jgi:hypothetical protein
VPPVNLPPDILRTISGLQSQLNALQTQQQYGCIDNELRLRIVMGQQADGTYGLWLYDTDGNVKVKIGDLGGGITEGPYGLQVYNATGRPLEVSPPLGSFFAGSISTTLTTYSAGAGSPSVTAPIGASGDALITVSSLISLTNVNDTGQVGISLDGGAAINVLATSSTASIVANSCSVMFRASELFTLTPNADHTFQLQQKGSTAGHTFTFQGNALVVWPI